MGKIDKISLLTYALFTIQIQQNAHLSLADNCLNKRGAYLRYDILGACQSLAVFHMEWKKVLKKWPKVARKSCLNCSHGFGCFNTTVEQTKMKRIDSQNFTLERHLDTMKDFLWHIWQPVLQNSCSVGLVDHWLTDAVPGFFWDMGLHVYRKLQFYIDQPSAEP